MNKKLRGLWPYLTLWATWEFLLIINKSSWRNFILLPAGALVGYLILELNWFSSQKKILNILPLILLPVTLFILTSTPGILEKALIIFLNLRLLLDKNNFRQDNLKT